MDSIARAFSAEVLGPFGAATMYIILAVSVLGFGEDWVGLGATAPPSTVPLAAEAEAPGAFGRNVSGFGLAERVCLRSDFAGAPG